MMRPAPAEGGNAMILIPPGNVFFERMPAQILKFTARIGRDAQGIDLIGRDETELATLTVGHQILPFSARSTTASGSLPA